MTTWAPWWIAACLATAALAVVFPWRFRGPRRLTATVCLLLALGTFVSYEIILYRSVPSDTVVFQLDLVVLVPLLLVAAVSCAIAMYQGGGGTTA